MISISTLVSPVFLRTPYNYDADSVSQETGLLCEDKSLAQQQFLEESDINTIVRRFNLTGQLPDNVRAPQYADFEAVFDFQTAMNAIRSAEESFMAMPAAVRSRFSNDPQLFVEFCSDPGNLDEARKLGLAMPLPVDKSPAPAGDVAPAGGATAAV